ncbi:hypothetical protein [Amycolatopsis sp. Hca4]|uniref:hypothetical protein n=1 Tax=Amycolatopsis sp. Hca4 TaxID=2742131 RepID=UPI0015922BFE|nr:hypothetical protein [Amycolatopsis sp. Hca4]QKV74600.1 hypothetical protein HUT10_13075 [Amycolatopsis sp. Hca4]
MKNLPKIALTTAGIAALGLAVGAPAAAGENPSAGSATILAGCGAQFDDVTVDGGQAAWNLVCASGGITIGGWVKDTKADGKCAYIKAFAGNGESRVPLAKACPKNTVTQFSWRVENSNEIRAYLFVA